MLLDVIILNSCASRDATIFNTTMTSGINNIIDLSRYSILSKLLHVTGYALKFVANIGHPTAKQTRLLTVKELSTAVFKWEEKYNTWSYDKKRPPLVQQLQLFLDDIGYLRCYGRMHKVPVSKSAKISLLVAITTYIDNSNCFGCPQHSITWWSKPYYNCTEAEILDHVSTKMW